MSVNCKIHQVYADNEMIQEVINRITTDALLPEEIRACLKTFDVTKLTFAPSPLDNIVSSDMLTSAAREKSWAKFQSVRKQIQINIDLILHSKQLAALICLEIADDLIKRSFISQSNKNSNSSPFQIDIVKYVAGFVLFRSKKYFINDSLSSNVISKLISNDKVSKLISVKSRDGLIEPSSEIVPFFLLLESEFRRFSPTCSTCTPSVHSFVESNL